MVPEAPLERNEHGLAPKGEGWFVLNAREAGWRYAEGRGAYSQFEGDVEFPQLGIHLVVLAPGEPMSMYHWEVDQEDFLVLAGECLLLIEGGERRLRAWDFVHCPPGTEHTFVGAGDRPCIVFMTGARSSDGTIVYPRSQLALDHGAGVEEETSSPHDAYARFGHWRLGRPESWQQLPWA
jgi:uncharacterized cupin superfamily protein